MAAECWATGVWWAYRRRVRRAVTLLLLVAACKESGPTEADLKARAEARRKLCEQHRPRLEARWAWFTATAHALRGADPLEHEVMPVRGLKLRELHLFDKDAAATADANSVGDFDGPKRGITGSCLHRVEECKVDDASLEDALKGCASIDAWVVLRTTHQEDPKPIEGYLKYKPGSLRAEAYVYALDPPDGGAAVQLGAFEFGTKLRGDVEIYREWTTEQINAALYEAMRTSAWKAIEQRLNAPAED